MCPPLPSSRFPSYKVSRADRTPLSPSPAPGCALSLTRPLAHAGGQGGPCAPPYTGALLRFCASVRRADPGPKRQCGIYCTQRVTAHVSSAQRPRDMGSGSLLQTHKETHVFDEGQNFKKGNVSSHLEWSPPHSHVGTPHRRTAHTHTHPTRLHTHSQPDTPAPTPTHTGEGQQGSGRKVLPMRSRRFTRLSTSATDVALN